MRVTVHNRGDRDAPLHLLPQLWFHNTLSWGYDPAGPSLSSTETGCIAIHHSVLGDYHCHLDGEPELLFCDKDTNLKRLHGVDASGHFKDAFHDTVIDGNQHAANPLQGESETGVFGDNDKLQNDPHFRDHLLFHEYFHGDNGRGTGASHQTGWTGLLATLLNKPLNSKNP